MDKIQEIKSNKKFLTIGVVTILAIFLTNASSLNGVFAADNGGYTFFDCVFDNDKGTEICCDGPDDNIKCLECDVDLTTGQKSNCHEVPNTPKSGKNIQTPGSVFDDRGLGIQKDQTEQTQGQVKSPPPLSSSK